MYGANTEAFEKPIPTNNIGAREAIPLLEGIFSDTSEIYYFRGDALQAIAMIDLEYGKKLARQYAGNDKHISMIAQSILVEDELILERRSYWDALLSRHD